MFFSPRPSRDSATVVDHCRLALDLALNGIGPRGLPLLGSGDWDDGYDAAGRKGRGESVWMAFFVHRLLRATARCFRPRTRHATTLPPPDCATPLARRGRVSIYVRAYDDDGRPFGGIPRADGGLARTFGRGPFDQALTAAEAGFAALAEPRLVRLLTPPYTLDADPGPGGWRAIRQGLRENGGQYSHGPAGWWTLSLPCLGSRRPGRSRPGGTPHEPGGRGLVRISPLSRLRARRPRAPCLPAAPATSRRLRRCCPMMAAAAGPGTQALPPGCSPPPTPLLGITMREGIPSVEEVPGQPAVQATLDPVSPARRRLARF